LDGAILIALRGLPVPFPSAAQFASFIAARHEEVVGVVRVKVHEGRRGGSSIEVLHGRPWLEERVAGTRFRIPAATFFQVNSDAAEVLAGIVVECSEPVDGARVLELYGGVGVFSFALARRGAPAPVVVEADFDAVACGRDAIAPEVAAPPVFVHSDVSRYLRSMGNRANPVDLVVADPPRTGLGRGVVEGIAALEPSRLVLVSCDPATLGRDTRDLGKVGFVPRRFVPLDLFPQTASVEAVAVFERS
jgi:23S rRNA (uracil1939-C5)-methyltransferase